MGAATIAIDQLTKLWVRSNLELRESIPSSGFIRLTHISNDGAAFGLLQGHTELLSLISVVILVIMMVVLASFYKELYFWQGRMGSIAMGLVSGGAIGNLIDRFTLGEVTDFIDIGPWPVFNLADSAVVVGIGIALYLLIFSSSRQDSTNEYADHFLRR